MNLDVERVLSCLQDVKQVKPNHWMARCPAHDDSNPSLSVTVKGDKVLVKCFAGCDQNTVWNRILELAGVGKRYNVYRNGKNGHRPTRRQKVTAATTDANITMTDEPTPTAEADEPTPTHSQAQETAQGCSLKEIANAKQLPVQFLKELGVSQWYDTDKTPRLRIPYYDVEGNEIACRLRMNLTGQQRFKWRKGSTTALYGLWKLNEAQEAGYILLVEGESDCWTLWYCGIPAVGLPGKSTWQQEWAKHLQGLRVYIWQEPDAPELPLKVGQALPDACVITAREYKDPSEAYLSLGRETFVQWLQEQMQQAEPVKDIIKRAADAELQQLYGACREVREHPDPLELVKKELARLYAGDFLPAYATYLAATTRLLADGDGNMPAHLLLVGSPSCGKSHAIKVVQRLLPESAYVKFDATSQRALIYCDEDFRHRVLFISEADSLPTSDRGEDNPAASAIRTLLQDGSVEYAVVVPQQNATPKVEIVRKDGPTVLITSSTRPFGEQLSSRLFTLPMRDDVEQLSAAVEAICRFQNEKPAQPAQALIDYQDYLQRLAPFEVKVPFAEALGRCIARDITGPRILRDLQRLLAMVKAVAILRGRTEATLDDYREAADVVSYLYEQSAIGVTERVRTVVHCVHRLRSELPPDAVVTLHHIAKETELHPQQVKRAVHQALAKGWLVNRSRGRNYDLALGEKLPDEVSLPTAEDVYREWTGDNPTPPDGDDFTTFHAISHQFHAISRISRHSEVLSPPSPPSEAVDAMEGEGGGVYIPRGSVKRVKQRESDVKRCDVGVKACTAVEIANERGGVIMDLLPLHRWLLNEFAGEKPTWAELQRRAVEYCQDDEWGQLVSRDELVEAVRQLMQSGQVRRIVEGDQPPRYEFPLDPAEDTLVEFGKPVIPAEEFLMTRRRREWESCKLDALAAEYSRWCRRRGGRPAPAEEFLVAVRRVASVRRAPGRPAEAICVEGISVEEERVSLKRTE